jgi:hypothetical protein
MHTVCFRNGDVLRYVGVPYVQGGGDAMFICKKFGCHCGSECVDTHVDGLSTGRSM